MPCHFLVFSLRTPFCRDAVIQAPPFCRENLVSLYNLRGHDPTRVISRGIYIHIKSYLHVCCHFFGVPNWYLQMTHQPTYQKKHVPRQTTPAAVVIIETVATVSNVTFLDLEPWLVFPKWRGTPLKSNMEHNTEGLEDDFPFQIGAFQVPC